MARSYNTGSRGGQAVRNRISAGDATGIPSDRFKSNEKDFKPNEGYDAEFFKTFTGNDFVKASMPPVVDVRTAKSEVYNLMVESSLQRGATQANAQSMAEAVIGRGVKFDSGDQRKAAISATTLLEQLNKYSPNGDFNKMVGRVGGSGKVIATGGGGVIVGFKAKPEGGREYEVTIAYHGSNALAGDDKNTYGVVIKERVGKGFSQDNWKTSYAAEGGFDSDQVRDAVTRYMKIDQKA
jgi:hypothetical protein